MGSQDEDESLDQASLIANLMNPQTQMQREPLPPSSAPPSPLHSSGIIDISLRPATDERMDEDESLLGPMGEFVVFGDEDSHISNSETIENHPAPNAPQRTPLPTKHLTDLNRRTTPLPNLSHNSSQDDSLGLGTDVSPSRQVTSLS